VVSNNNVQISLYFLDREGGSQKATLVVLVAAVISSLKILKAFLICSGAQRNFCVHIRAHIPYRSTVSDFQLTSRYHFCDQSSFHVIALKLDIEPSLKVQLHCSGLLQQIRGAAPAAARCVVERSDEYLCTGGTYRRPTVE